MALLASPLQKIIMQKSTYPERNIPDIYDLSRYRKVPSWARVLFFRGAVVALTGLFKHH